MAFLYCLYLLLVCHCHKSSGATVPVKNKSPSNCAFQGYIPGGKAKTISDINTPTATLVTNQMASVMSRGGKVATLAMHTKNLGTEISKLVKDDNIWSKVKTFAPKLGPSLGIFGAVAGIIVAETSPKPQDILDAANVAFGKLTKDVNDKISSLQGYVNTQIINKLSNLLSLDYEEQWELWSDCITMYGRDAVNECQRDAYHGMKALKSKFARHWRKLQWKKNSRGKFMNYGEKQYVVVTDDLTLDELREVEAYMVPCRNFFNLIMMVLKALIEVYADDDSCAGKFYYNKYRNRMKIDYKFYVRYFKTAINQLKAFWNNKHLKIPRPCSTYGEIRCSGPSKHYDYWQMPIWGANGDTWDIPTWTANDWECSCLIDANQQICKVDLEVRIDGKTPSSYTLFDTRGQGERGGVTTAMKTKLDELRTEYEDDGWEVVEEYWRQELLVLMPIWRKSMEEYTKGEDKEECPLSEYTPPNDNVSDRYKERRDSYLKKRIF